MQHAQGQRLGVQRVGVRNSDAGDRRCRILGQGACSGGRVGDDRSRQQAIEAARCEGGRFDAARLLFELPVTAAKCGSGGVYRGGNIGTGCSRQGGKERATTGTTSDIAAVQQYVGVAREAGADVGEPGANAGQSGQIQGDVADFQDAFRAVGYQVQGIDRRAGTDSCGDLIQRAAGRVEDNDLDPAADTGDDFLPAGDGRVDKH